MTDSTHGAEEFEALRPRLFGIAYRMTGSVGDAEDACQDAWLRWQRVDRASVDNAEAFLVRVVTRLALDRLQSATRRRPARNFWALSPLSTGTTNVPRAAG